MTRTLLPLSWLVAASCSGALPLGPASKPPDADGDGYDVAGGDCDDHDPDVRPGGIDLPGDGIDQDCDGADATSLPARALSPGDVLVTEVLRDPIGVPSDLGEWFEITSQRDEPVDLMGVEVTDGVSDTFLVTLPLVVPPRGVVVLAGGDDPARNGGVTPDLRWPAGFGLGNGEDRISLRVAGVVIDEVAWDVTWPRLDGHALSRDAAGVWCLAGDDAVYGVGGWGTPGAANPDCPPPFGGLVVADLQYGDLVITEVMQNPLAVDDDFGEWFEVRVLTEQPVDLLGLVVEDDTGDAFEVRRSLVAAPGDNVVFGSFLDPAVDGGAPVDAEWRWDFGLANSGDTIRLLAGTVLVDEIAYDNGATFPDPDGAAMALDPGAVDADANDDGSRWCVAATPYGDGDLGSPGADNPSCP
ncbi:MAG: lamin tail domain-containing protein [Myxococcota bacterium]